MANSVNRTHLVDGNEIFKLQARPNFIKYVKSIWNRRYFILAQARASNKANGRDRYLGRLWVVLDPLLQVATYAIIFGVILQIDRGIDNFVGFLVIGVVFFGFLSKGVTGGTSLIKGNKAFISAFNFPCASLAFSAILKQLHTNWVPATLAIVGAVLFQLDQPIHPTVFLAIPLFFLIHLFNLGATLIVGRITAFIPDFSSIVQLLARGLFFVSGVFFTVSRFESSPLLKSIVEANPLYQFLMALRTAVLDGQTPSMEVWGYLSLWSFSLVTFGFIFFWRAEERYSSVQ